MWVAAVRIVPERQLGEREDRVNTGRVQAAFQGDRRLGERPLGIRAAVGVRVGHDVVDVGALRSELDRPLEVGERQALS